MKGTGSDVINDDCVKDAQYQPLVLTSMYLASLYTMSARSEAALLEFEQDLFLFRKIIHWVKPLSYLSHPCLQAVACRLNE